MKINEVEKIIGITKKNIRFYEAEGLLSPGRSKENGYRDYSDADIKKLAQIKLFRKLGVPLEEIRSMQVGKATVGDIMKRHLVTLERSSKNIACSMEFCNSLKDKNVPLTELDAQQLLLSIEDMENRGATFKNVSSKDVKPMRYAGAAVASCVMIAFMVVLFFILLLLFRVEEAPLILKISLLAIPVIITVGVIYSLIQRVGEIRKGEIDDAKFF